MKFKALFSVIGFLLMLFATNTVLADQTALPSPTNKQVAVLFTQTASSATLDPHQSKQRWYTLTLHDVDPDVLWFSERPNRLSGNLNINDFIKYWNQKTQQSFTKSHPNANLIAINDENGVKTKVSGVFVLTNPVYDAQNKTLTYNIYSIRGTFNKKASLEHVALFVDGAQSCEWCPWG